MGWTTRCSVVKQLSRVVKKKGSILIVLHCVYLRCGLSSGALNPLCEAILREAVTASWMSFLKHLLPLKAMKAMSVRNEAGSFAALSSWQLAVAQESRGGQQQQDEN